MKPEKLKTERQKLINDFLGWLEYVLGNTSKDRLVNNRGEALFALSAISKYKIDYKLVLKGLYIWSAINRQEVIEKAEEKYKTDIGFGSHYLVDMQQLAKNGINADDLEHFNHDDMVKFYRDINLITNQEKVWKEPEGKIKFLFIRHSLGAGISPDLAIMLAGALYGRDAALGIVLAQALDTLSKYVHQYNDYMDDIHRDIKRKFTELDISEDEILSFLDLVVLPDDKNRDVVPQSSLLDLFTLDIKTGLTPFEAYLAFIGSKPLVPIIIGTNRISSLDFFRYVNQMLVKSRMLDSIPSHV